MSWFRSNIILSDAINIKCSIVLKEKNKLGMIREHINDDQLCHTWSLNSWNNIVPDLVCGRTRRGISGGVDETTAETAKLGRCWMP